MRAIILSAVCAACVISSAQAGQTIARFGVRNIGSDKAPIYTLAGGDRNLIAFEALDNGSVLADVAACPPPTTPNPCTPITQDLQVRVEHKTAVIASKSEDGRVTFKPPAIEPNGVAVIIIEVP